MKVFIIGDSTASIKKDENRPEAGWGELMAKYFSDEVELVNLALNGRSSKSYKLEEYFKQLKSEIAQGDYLFIQFGHNDGKTEDPNRYTDPTTQYRENLTEYINLARDEKATPILITSITRRTFSDGTLIKDTVGDYPQNMREVAKKESVLLIDAYKDTWDIVNSMPEEESKKIYLHLKPNEHPNHPNGITDNTHLSILGADTYAKCVAKQIYNSNCPLKNYIVLEP